MGNVIYTDSIDFRCLENLRETFLDLTLVHTGKEACKPYHAFSGTHEEYIIHFVISGAGFYSADGNTWALGPGQMFLIYPGEPVVYCADKNTPWVYTWVGFKGLKADTVLKQCGFSKKCLILPAPEPNDYMNYINDMLEHRTLTFSNDLRRESSLLLLFSILANHHAQLSHNGKPERLAYGNNVYVELAIDYIEKMYMHGIGVSDIADSIGISRAHLNQAFQKELNLSVQRFLIDFRLHKSASLLISTTLSIKEISNRMGYNDQLIFSKAFKKKFGMSPRNYRIHTDKMDIFKDRQ